MNCEALRERIAEDPARRDGEFERHAATCAACRAYQDRLLRTEALIRKALRFDVDVVSRASDLNGTSRWRRSRWLTWTSGAAAGLLTAVSLWFLLGGRPDLTPEQLAMEIAEHWYHEPDSWTATDVGVSPQRIDAVLDGDAEIDLSLLTTVSYVESCWVAGEWIPHLVVQGEQGPYMVLLLPERALESPVPVSLPAEGLGGRIVPAGRGSIAVVGQPTEELERIETAVRSAVDWAI